MGYLLLVIACLCSSLQIYAGGLDELQKRLAQELQFINYPPLSWHNSTSYTADGQCIHDVAIVGAGMAGMSVAFALLKLGITDIQLFDKCTEGKEGCWLNYARMEALRSHKALTGPALELPSLTFQAWYQAQYGSAAWEALYKIPTKQWADYLYWYRQVLQLPVSNNCFLQAISPEKEYLTLTIEKEGKLSKFYCRKIILATGRMGFGGWETPSFLQEIPKSFWAHSVESIDFVTLKGKKVAILGAGASAFDAAAVALEEGAERVDMIMRRFHVPAIGKVASLFYPGFYEGYYQLSDEQRWRFLSLAFSVGSPPPVESLRRVQRHLNVALYPNTTIDKVFVEGDKIFLETSRGLFAFDFLILGTGFLVDGEQQPELANLIHDILLWKDRSPLFVNDEKLGRFPYLGRHFEFMEKKPGASPHLKNIYCFNYGAVASHGWVSSDISGIGIGAQRLAQGIAADLFAQDADSYLQCLDHYMDVNFDEEEFSFIQRE